MERWSAGRRSRIGGGWFDGELEPPVRPLENRPPLGWGGAEEADFISVAFLRAGTRAG